MAGDLPGRGDQLCRVRHQPLRRRLARPARSPATQLRQHATSILERDHVATASETKPADYTPLTRPGHTLAIVGESGCGKTMTALSLLRLVPNPPGRIVAGSIKIDGKDLVTLDEAEMRAIRGNEISMIFQEPMNSLNPVFTIGNQISETIR